MNIFKATADFEQWLAKRLPIVRQDVALKHALMAQNPFSFFRATFYRWLQHWPEVCPKLAKAPAVLGVGDLHIENFGTWRDTEGRLIWGVNDFDEAWAGAHGSCAFHCRRCVSHGQAERSDAGVAGAFSDSRGIERFEQRGFCADSDGAGEFAD